MSSRALQNWPGWLNRNGTAKVTIIMSMGNNKKFQGIRPRVDSIVGLRFGLNVSISRERCRGGGTIGARVQLERGYQEHSKNSVDLLIGWVQIKLKSERQGVSMYLLLSLSLGKGFFSFTLSRLARCVHTDE